MSSDVGILLNQKKPKAGSPARSKAVRPTKPSSSAESPVTNTKAKRPRLSNLANDGQNAEGVLLKKPKPSKPKASLKKRRKSLEAEEAFFPALPLPPELARLESLFKCLNTVHSFLTAQRQVTCTYDGLKSGVESLFKREFLPEDLGAMAALYTPISLYWAPYSSLKDATLVEMKLSVGLPGISPMRKKKRRQDEEGDDGLGMEAEDDYVLVVDFKDMKPLEVTGQKAILDKNGRHVGTGQQSLIKEVARPASQIRGLPKFIEKRNVKFSECLHRFYAECVEKGEDCLAKLSSISTDALPGSPTTVVPRMHLPIPPSQGGLLHLLDSMKTDPYFSDRLVENGWRTLPPREPSFSNLNHPLSPKLIQALNAAGVQRLYSHQADAINAIDEGHNVVISTSTSSGKSLIYQVPVLKALEHDPNTRAMFIFPTKALAQDQRRSLMAFLEHCDHLRDVSVDTYDGDTVLERNERGRIREWSSVIFTNPDMVHVSINPNHKSWVGFLTSLKYVIVDELHFYGGRFGAHCALVMRRLRRLLQLVGNDSVQFICCSATIANPVQHMNMFFGINNAVLIDIDGSPCGQKHHLVWTAPYRNPKDKSQGRGSFLDEAVAVCKLFVERRVKFICFAKTRRMCELVLKDLRSALSEMKHGLDETVIGYRGGYTKIDRREIEGMMFNGELIGIVATNAMELGVDIGSIDSHNLTDQRFLDDPESLHGSTLDYIHLDIWNPQILEPHLQCAAAERGLTVTDLQDWFCGEDSGIDVLKNMAQRFLMWDEKFGVFFSDRKYENAPAKWVQIRCIDEEESYRVVDVVSGRELEDVEAERAPFTLYEGSIFIHQGRTFYVFDVNVEKKYARVRPTNVDYMTVVRDYSDVDPVRTLDSIAIRTDVTEANEGFAHFGDMTVTTRCFGYLKLNPKTNQLLETVTLQESDAIIRPVQGIWADIPDATVAFVRSMKKDVEFSIHAASHALLSIVPNYVVIPTTGATITMYEHIRAGHMMKSFPHMRDLLVKARDRIVVCECETGCHECIVRPNCKHVNDALDKDGAVMVLQGLLGELVAADSEVQEVKHL
ncbi:hypothetical protein HK101_001429 [Irineochytrium annulatum]|nr:hypothetical protein HK101_001429 [Irineochytrium annulatum]